MIYRLTIVFRERISLSVETEQDNLPRKGEVVSLTYSVDGEKGSEYFEVMDVIHYPLVKRWDGLPSSAVTQIQILLDAKSDEDDPKVALITSPKNKQSLGEWTKGRMESPTRIRNRAFTGSGR